MDSLSDPLWIEILSFVSAENRIELGCASWWSFALVRKAPLHVRWRIDACREGYLPEPEQAALSLDRLCNFYACCLHLDVSLSIRPSPASQPMPHVVERSVAQLTRECIDGIACVFATLGSELQYFSFADSPWLECLLTVRATLPIVSILPAGPAAVDVIEFMEAVALLEIECCSSLVDSCGVRHLDRAFSETTLCFHYVSSGALWCSDPTRGLDRSTDTCRSQYLLPFPPESHSLPATSSGPFLVRRSLSSSLIDVSFCLFLQRCRFRFRPERGLLHVVGKWVSLEIDYGTHAITVREGGLQDAADVSDVDLFGNLRAMLDAASPVLLRSERPSSAVRCWQQSLDSRDSAHVIISVDPTRANVSLAVAGLFRSSLYPIPVHVTEFGPLDPAWMASLPS